MDARKRRRLEAAGWKVGTTQEFLGLTDEESAYVETKLRLAKALASRRTKRNLTQVKVAKLLNSSQSRVAKMEAADPSVTADLLIRALYKLGATRREVAKAIAG